jgi:uncharacterized protein (DUF2336 family)
VPARRRNASARGRLKTTLFRRPAKPGHVPRVLAEDGGKALVGAGRLGLHRAFAHPTLLERFVAKLKKSARNKPAAAGTSSAELQARAEHLSRSLVESAQQIWMAGVGAFNRAQGEGSKLFEALVSEGMYIDKHTRKLATGRVVDVRDAV